MDPQALMDNRESRREFTPLQEIDIQPVTLGPPRTPCTEQGEQNERKAFLRSSGGRWSAKGAPRTLSVVSLFMPTIMLWL